MKFRPDIFAGIIGALILPSAGHCQSPFIEGDIVHPNTNIAIGADFKLLSGRAIISIVDGTIIPEIAGSSSLVLKLSQAGAKTSPDYNLRLLDRSGNVLQSITKTEFASRSEVWSKEIPGDYVSLEIEAALPPTGAMFSLQAVAFEHRGITKYSIIHNPPDLEPIKDYAGVPQIVSASNPIGKIEFFSNEHKESCSGFLIDDEQFLTNKHCIASDDVCKSGARVTFGYQLDKDGSLKSGEPHACLGVVDSNIELDFALVRLDGMPGKKWGHLELTRRQPAVNEQAFLIQHPGGQPKQIARKQCYVSTLAADWKDPGTDMGHQCDSANGSSGSPLLGKDFKVIGLHHLGVGDDEKLKENRAVRILKIMDFMHMK
jgi:V8-like Glu-specific endopeptidase